ncbi:hypothetical protein ABLO26_28915 [Neobacillus sp. 179-J 1A1 HS]|uniref:hypothetical protein n=1 Tax=Neobacillus driksii TaxID=3035913 RepID=UPI0035BBF6D1
MLKKRFTSRKHDQLIEALTPTGTIMLMMAASSRSSTSGHTLPQVSTPLINLL